MSLWTDPRSGINDVFLAALRIGFTSRPLIYHATSDLRIFVVVDHQDGDVWQTGEWSENLFPLG